MSGDEGFFFSSSGFLVNVLVFRIVFVMVGYFFYC